MPGRAEPRKAGRGRPRKKPSSTDSSDSEDAADTYPWTVYAPDYLRQRRPTKIPFSASRAEGVAGLKRALLATVNSVLNTNASSLSEVQDRVEYLAANHARLPPVSFTESEASKRTLVYVYRNGRIRLRDYEQEARTAGRASDRDNYDELVDSLLAVNPTLDDPSRTLAGAIVRDNLRRGIRDPIKMDLSRRLLPLFLRHLRESRLRAAEAAPREAPGRRVYLSVRAHPKLAPALLDFVERESARLDALDALEALQGERRESPAPSPDSLSEVPDPASPASGEGGES